MATCNNWFYAEDQDGNELSFGVGVKIYEFVGGSWNWVINKWISSAAGANTSLTVGVKHKAVPDTDHSGYTTPNEQTWTACLKDITLVYTKQVAEGDILRGDSYPSSQTPGERMDIVVDIKNKGSVSGYFVLSYYEGSTHLRTASRAWVSAGQTITDISERFTMPDRDFVVTVRIHNESTEEVDDTYNITCYLIGGTDYYVKTNGNDELPGSSWAMAWATIDKAAITVPDGATVHIGFGDYNNEPAGNKIAPQNVGTEGIWYMPETANSEGGTGTVTIEKNA